MLLKKAIIKNYRGCCGPTTIDFSLFNCIVGQNDAGKSTILKALDLFLNETKPTRADLFATADQQQFSVELYFDCERKEYFLGEQIKTTIEDEELIDTESLLVIKKVWPVGEANVGNAKVSLLRKKYEGNHDFIFKTETQLISQCKSNGIDTTKGNGEDYNNVEKRQKLREYNSVHEIPYSYEWEELPSTGQSKTKAIADVIKKVLPSFQYFKADTSLSDTDTAIQKYFKEMAYHLIEEEGNTNEIENHITSELESVLGKITNKINDVVKSSESVQPKIEFDWSKLISTSFVSTSTGNPIPLSSRGDGFRRITMMAYFEYLAETERANADQNIIFGFEEPETFLHPSAQENLFDKLHSLSENGYQVILSTHSPTIVGNTKRNNIIHVSKPENIYTVNQSNVDYKELARDLGIKPDNTFTPLFSTSRLLLLVEGIDDVNAMHYNARTYKNAGLIADTFEELNVNIIPIGGCDGIKHWVNLDLFTKLDKPFFIFLDSDRSTPTAVSQNYTNLVSYGLVNGVDFMITKKRALENYIHHTALQRLVTTASIAYGDFDHVKNLCKTYPDETVRGHLGGKNVAEKHYCKLTIAELKMTWDDGNEDEFLNLYSAVTSKLS